MRPHAWVAGVKRVQQAYAVRLVHAGELMGVEPPNLVDLRGRCGQLLDDSAAEHECDDPTFHVLVDPGESERLDSQAGLLCHLSDQPPLDRLTQLEDSAR